MYSKQWVFLLFLFQIVMSTSELEIQLKHPESTSISNITTERGICAENEVYNGNCTWHNRTLQCHRAILNVTSIQFHQLVDTQEIIFCRWTNETFDPSILEKFPKLIKFHFEDGALLHIERDFPHLKHLKVEKTHMSVVLASMTAKVIVQLMKEHINISYTRLTHLHSSIFKHLSTIKTIDLRKNQFDYYDGSLILPSKLQELYLSENPYDCSKNFKWIMNISKTKHIMDRQFLQCGDNRFKNQSIVTVMRFKSSLREMCHRNIELRNCTCMLSYIALDLDEVWRPMYSINCNNLNLTRLPISVPDNTTIFYAQYNQISGIEPLLNAYRSVHDIYLDYNQISTIETLESNNFLERFRAFSLKGNQLTKLPVYLLNNALERNHQANSLYLSENPWRCECNFMLKFQDLLQSHRDIIKDASEIQCVKIEGEETILYSVLLLNIWDICFTTTEHTIQPIDILNAVLATFIIFIICKLIYDYYNFRTYGLLPWIVTKMP